MMVVRTQHPIRRYCFRFLFLWREPKALRVDAEFHRWWHVVTWHISFASDKFLNDDDDDKKIGTSFYFPISIKIGDDGKIVCVIMRSWEAPRRRWESHARKIKCKPSISVSWEWILRDRGKRRNRCTIVAPRQTIVLSFRLLPKRRARARRAQGKSQRWKQTSRRREKEKERQRRRDREGERREKKIH